MYNYYLLAQAYRSSDELLTGMPRQTETWESFIKKPDNDEDKNWPYRISISFDDEDSTMPIMVHEGTGGHCSYTDVGVAADAFTKPGWMYLIEKANGLWLIPYLERMAKGERISKHELLNEYKLRETEKAYPSFKEPLHNESVFYHLAHGKAIPNNEEYTPSDVYISFDNISHPIDLSRGNGYHYQWARVSASDALEIKWLQNFENADGLWLMPYIERMATSASVTAEEVAAKYQAIHGKAPEAY